MEGVRVKRPWIQKRFCKKRREKEWLSVFLKSTKATQRDCAIAHARANIGNALRTL